MGSDRAAPALQILVLFVRLALGTVFLYAGIEKTADPHAFAQAIHNYRLLPGWTIAPVAVVLPWVEILVGVSLLTGIYTYGAALVASGLLWTFMVALGASLLRGLDISCGCFNSSEGSITWFYLLRDALLLGAGILVFIVQPRWNDLFSFLNGA